jgi:hypothetical protein
MGFESAHFKLSHEMTQLLDPSGTMKSDTWNQFLRYVFFFTVVVKVDSLVHVFAIYAILIRLFFTSSSTK